jgi:DNA-binding response OmpR family regulator
MVTPGWINARDESTGGVLLMATILIIEDEAPVRSALRRILERDRHLVIEAIDGEDGMNAFTRSRIDLVITDLLMPNHRGSVVIDQIRALDQEIPIIAMSGSDDEGGPLAEAMELGASLRIGKPFDVEELLAAVSVLLDSGDQA